MFASRRQGTVIAKGLKIVGSVTAEGLVEVNGQIGARLFFSSPVNFVRRAVAPPKLSILTMEHGCWWE